MNSIRKHLTEYLMRINSYEIMAERIRQKIAENGYFQTGTVFQRFDKFKKGYLVPDDFAQFMLDNQIYPTEVQLYLIFRDFDKERVGVVTLQRFADQLLPKQNSKLHKKAVQRKYYPPSLRLEIDLEFIIAKYFIHKIQQTKQLSVIRSQMFQKQVFTVQEAFTLIDQQRQGVIYQLQQIDRFLRSNGKVVNKDELVRIFRVLTFDSSDKILYETFSQHLDPMGKGYYIGYAQRMAQKDIVYRDHLKQKLQINTQAARNTRQRIIIDNSLIDLHESNRRLGHLLKRQQLQQLRQQEQLMALRFQHNF